MKDISGENNDKLRALDPKFEVIVRRVIARMEARGWAIRVVWGRRTKAENDALVLAGFADTNSLHLSGRGADLVDRMTGYTTDKLHQYYIDLATIAKSEGLKWGGEFSRWDPCHVEMY